jgi:hypothetical protein
MRKAPLKIGRLFINILLAAGIIGLLAVYVVIVSDLPSRLYTTDQWEYLSYNKARSITQSAPTLDAQMAEIKEGVAVTTALSEWETNVDATLTAHYEEQAGVIITVYDLDYQSEYLLTYPGPAESATVTLFFPFPNNLETLHEVRFLVDGEEPPGAQYSVQGISWQADLTTDQEHKIVINYKADGVNSFAYGLQQNRRSDVDVTLTILGLQGSEVPQFSLPTTDVAKLKDGERFTWQFTGLIPSRDIQINLPTSLSFTQRVAQLQDEFRTIGNWAPILIGLFLASLAILLRFADVRLPLESYLMIGFALALFYPTLTFLSGLLDVTLAAILSLVTVSALLVTFLGLTVGWRHTWWRVGLLLVIFLGIFSLGVLTPWRRLLTTGGGLLLVATFMIAYARRTIPPEPEPMTELEPIVEPEPESAPEIAPASPPEEAAASEPVRAYCPQCGRDRGDDYAFCPGCGYSTKDLHRCKSCDHEQHTSPEAEKTYCLHCGEPLQ